eukprot:3560956-Prorocentrum_lima.AAC.1
MCLRGPAIVVTEMCLSEKEVGEDREMVQNLRNGKNMSALAFFDDATAKTELFSHPQKLLEDYAQAC